jgi:hypothetical protein
MRNTESIKSSRILAHGQPKYHRRSGAGSLFLPYRLMNPGFRFGGTGRDFRARFGELSSQTPARS